MLYHMLLDVNNRNKQVSSKYAFQFPIRNPCGAAWLWLYFFPKTTCTFRHVALFVLTKSLCATLEEETIILFTLRDRAQIQGKQRIS